MIRVRIYPDTDGDWDVSDGLEMESVPSLGDGLIIGSQLWRVVAVNWRMDGESVNPANWGGSNNDFKVDSLNEVELTVRWVPDSIRRY